MRAGLVPIINDWCSIPLPEDLKNIGLIDGEDNSEEIIEDISEKIGNAALITSDRYRHLVQMTLKESEKYTQDSYTQTYNRAINQIVYGVTE